MIDWDTKAVATHACQSFAGKVMESAQKLTGMEFTILPVDGGPNQEIVTSNPDAVKLEYGNVDMPGGSWSVKAIIEAERAYGQP